MARHEFDYELDTVLPFAQSLIEGLARTEGMRAIGLRKDGALETVVAARPDVFNHNLETVPGCNWMTRDYLRACFAYPFLVCGVQRLSGYVNSSNLAARRLNEHFGYRVEATLRGAAPDGGDVLIYVMWRKDCRYV